MKILEIGLLTDENINPAVKNAIRAFGFDVFDVLENNLGGSDGEYLLSIAHQLGRVIVTHDSDFEHLQLPKEILLQE
jgi:predicted nuclease of predicted toxin-antitoxin system